MPSRIALAGKRNTPIGRSCMSESNKQRATRPAQVDTGDISMREPGDESALVARVVGARGVPAFRPRVVVARPAGQGKGWHL